ncbi:hypothetical protein C480_07157 [Natrialba aegyptia DSM 13077]|uniref:Uncharacterized protein n=1 Tax=Natrialba aegyptia DSM 13077 TaxID=1227491 RepID=M0B793_9EURY|nr:hypothetical protein C480_07157 [Natrialba aegyptia DSM 13077]
MHEDVPSKVIQNECTKDGRVAHAIVAESDALEDGVPVQTIVDWLSTFAEDWVGVDEYSFYYSGNRSIHLQTQQFVPGDEIDDLRLLAEEFNAMHDAKLDTSIYKENAQFRLVGAEHRKTGFHKVPISPDADRQECIKSAQTPPEQRQWPFELPAPSHHDELPRRFEGEDSLYSPPLAHYRPGFAGISPLPSEIGKQVLRGVYKSSNPGSVESGRNRSGYARPFSPYKKTGEGDARSVIVMEQVDGLRQDRWSQETYVPAKIEYAIGGGDGSFTRSNSRSLVELSPRDFRKWDFEKGDQVVIIGGNSGSSRLLKVEKMTASMVGQALESKDRQKAFEILSNRGFDVGSSGYNSSRFHHEVGDNEESEAAKIKRGIENGTRERSYDNLLTVVCRLLRIDGWDSAYNWCRDIFGPDFDPEETYEYLKGPAEAYSDYSHVDVPASVEDAKRRGKS